MYLRPPRDGDWASWAELRGSSRAFLEPWEPAWPGDALTRSAYRRRLRQVLEEWDLDSAYGFHIFHRRAESLVGGITLSNVRRGASQSGTVGYWIGQIHARKGHMTEALGCVADFAFGRLGLHRLEAACLPPNEASRRLLLKVGFVEEGYAEGYLRINGAWHDHVLFGMIEERWSKLRPRH